ncbi:hypothetical protein ABL78_1804 [Leptomonas seymouri]|uniref:MSP domain-containing protein n=1 Tax=Leptomonas seymouri TaxID=5684 RepID=A0A0N1ILZ1_LEPSE|nr:hypothetical protein ABL78_1804 [Leptomonas seymouri]|eukprot:KPI89068.1 hypothetical protein ABL78_1804 [Leptomonas seymouri]
MASHASSLDASPSPGRPTDAEAYRASKTRPQIKIEPSYLVFPPPHFGRCIQNAISIYNVSKQPCVFKMRCQNPIRYVAKPHVAVVAPESATRISVTLRDMNTQGMKNLPEDTLDRFRISIKFYDPSTVDAALSPKELWSMLQERGAKADHQQDLVSYFTKRDPPVGGLVMFFPPTYIPVTPAPCQEGAASRALGSDMDAAVSKKASSPSTAVADKRTPVGSTSGEGEGRSGSAAGGAAGRKAGAGAHKMPALWVGIAVAAMLVLSMAVVVGLTLRSGRGGCGGDAAVHAARADASVSHDAQQHLREANRAQASQAAEQARLQREQEELARLQQQRQRTEQAQRHDEHGTEELQQEPAEA